MGVRIIIFLYSFSGSATSRVNPRIPSTSSASNLPSANSADQYISNAPQTYPMVTTSNQNNGPNFPNLMRIAPQAPAQSGAAAALNLSMMTGPAPLSHRPDLNNNNSSGRIAGNREGLGSAPDSISLRWVKYLFIICVCFCFCFTQRYRLDIPDLLYHSVYCYQPWVSNWEDSCCCQHLLKWTQLICLYIWEQSCIYNSPACIAVFQAWLKLCSASQ